MHQRQAALAFQTAPNSRVCKPYIGFYARLTPHALFLLTVRLCHLCLPTSPRIEIKSLFFANDAEVTSLLFMFKQC